MIGVLNWKYVCSDDLVLNAINSKNFISRNNLADILGMNVKTLGRKIKALKDSGKLIIHRYADNNFIYMIGEDADFGWNAYEAKEIIAFRNDCEDGGHTVVDPSSTRIYYIDQIAPSLRISPELATELDECVDKLFPR